jgi:hypothetical protein
MLYINCSFGGKKVSIKDADLVPFENQGSATYRCVSVLEAVRVDDRENVIVEGLRQVLNHWVLTGQQLVQDVRRCGRSDPLSGVNS